VLRGHWQDKLFRRLAHIQWPVGTCGMVFADANGFAPVLDLVRLFQHPAMRYFDIIISYDAENPRRSRGVDWCNPHPTVRRMIPRHLPNIRSTMAMIPKAHWQFRAIPNDDRSPQRVMMLGTNHPKFPVDHKGGFVEDTSPDAPNLCDRIDLKHAEYQRRSNRREGPHEAAGP
jgi:hypothetical protein